MESNSYLICFKKTQRKDKLLWKTGVKYITTIISFCILHRSLQKINKTYKKPNIFKRFHYYLFPLLQICFCVADPFYSYLALLIPTYFDCFFSRSTVRANTCKLPILLKYFIIKHFRQTLIPKKKFSSVKGNYFKTTFIKKIDCS